ncbi:MAG TPA: sugar ABC transporter substrate-binding protein [Gammaproteobacteria bacterium]|nr:sugar ABC transporter substrate-binding protein [Gammaproteobacteria bacterium]
MGRLLTIVVIALLTACTTGGGMNADDAGVSTTGARTSMQPYHIGVDDQVEVKVWKNPELSVSAPVRPDGMISVPLIGDIKAGGKTPTEVADEIKERLAVYIRNADVTVVVTELRSHEFLSRVRVTGAVTTPSSMTYRPGMTVLDVVLEAGGPNEYAAPDSTKLYRKFGNETKIINIKLGRILNKGDLSSNIALEPGDVITVPERFF